MVLQNLFDFCSVMQTVYLVVSHGQRNQPGVLYDSFNNLVEVLLELVVRKVNFEQIFVVLKQKLSNDSCGMKSHALVFEANLVVSLVELHLGNESLLLFICLVRDA